ncbi:MAG: hypothetical protein JJ992_26985, partial [Planctomycetes bacterium]|nr:hypothetical protein [Planctomycetota bacterium]
LAGSTDGGDLGVARFGGDGSADATFDGDGYNSLALGASVDRTTVIAGLNGGRLLLGGRTGEGGITDSAFARIGANGLPDWPFGVDGIQTITFSPAADAEWVNQIVETADGRLYVLGTTGASSEPFVARLTANGALDADFAGDGLLPLFVGPDPVQAAVGRLTPDGDLLLAGNVTTASGTLVTLMKLNDNGDLDVTFGTGGLQSLSVGEGDTRIGSLAVQPDGAILLGVVGQVGSHRRGFIVRRLADGAADSSFSEDGSDDPMPGIEDEMLGNIFENVALIGVLRGGELAVLIRVDYEEVALAPYPSLYLYRYLPNGQLNAGFADGGVRAVNIAGGQSLDFQPLGYALQADGKLLVLGLDGNDLALARRSASGLADPDFGVEGFSSLGVTNPGQTSLSVGDQQRLFVGFTRSADMAAIAVKLGQLDFDADRAGDQWEVENGYDPDDPADSQEDTDGDGLAAFEEYLAGTNPMAADTDGDGLLDADEVALGLDPLAPSDCPLELCPSSGLLLKLVPILRERGDI